MGGSKLVLLWGLQADPPLAAVREQLRSLRVPCRLLDQRQVLETKIRLEVGDSLDGSLHTPDEDTDLGYVSAVYVRPYNSGEVPAVARSGRDSPAWRHALEVDDIMAAWLEIGPRVHCQSPGSHGRERFKAVSIETDSKSRFLRSGDFDHHGPFRGASFLGTPWRRDL